MISLYKNDIKNKTFDLAQDLTGKEVKYIINGVEYNANITDVSNGIIEVVFDPNNSTYEEGLKDFEIVIYDDPVTDDRRTYLKDTILIRRSQKIYLPSDLEQLIGWWRMDNGLFVVNNTHISNWMDESPNNNDLTQTTSTYSPLVKLNEYNELPIAYFDGTDDYLEASSLGSNILDKGGFEIYLFGRFGYSTGNVFELGDTTATEGIILTQDTATTMRITIGGISSSQFQAPTDYSLINIRYNANTFESIVEVNFGEALHEAVNTLGDADGQFVVGSSRQLTSFYRMDLIEAVVVKEILDDIERTKIETYFKSKYGL